MEFNWGFKGLITRSSNLDSKLSPCSVCCMFFFWVILRRLNFICRRCGTLCLLYLHGPVGDEWLSHLSSTGLWRWNRQGVPKHRHIKFRRQGITQKKTCNKNKYSCESGVKIYFSFYAWHFFLLSKQPIGKENRGAKGPVIRLPHYSWKRSWKRLVSFVGSKWFIYFL